MSTDTPTGRENSLANLAPENSLTHGAYGRPGFLMRCDRCAGNLECPHCEAGGVCAVEREYLQARRVELRSEPHIAPSDYPAVELLMQVECRIARAERFLAFAGDFTPVKGRLEWAPVAKMLPALLNTYQRMLQALSLTPSERRKMATGNGADAVLDKSIKVLDDKHKDDVLDADFEAEDEGEEEAADGGD